MTTDPRGEADRHEASILRQRFEARAPDLLRLGAIDLGSAFEQAIYTVLRAWERERPALRQPRSRSGGTGSARLVAVLLPFLRLVRAAPSMVRTQPAVRGGVLVLATAEVHLRLLAPVAREARRQGSVPVHVVTAGRGGSSLAAEPTDAGPFASVARLERHLRASSLAGLARHAAAVSARAGRASADWPQTDAERGEPLRRLAAASLPRLALMAAQLDAAIATIRPGVVATYDEAGIWSRLLPAVATARGLPAVDLPHGEAADPWGVLGADYDVFAVYGPRAASVLQSAGVPADRIAVVGAVAFDRLVGELALDSRTGADGGRMVLVASQPATPWSQFHTDAARQAVLASAVAVAEAVGASRVVIRPHPTETAQAISTQLAALQLPAGVAVEVDTTHDLVELLREAWVMITAFSQTTFEAVIAGVPTISVNVTGSPYAAEFAAEGLALPARDPRSAGSAASSLTDEDARRRHVATAREALRDRMGTLDGGATQRTADLLVRLARRT